MRLRDATGLLKSSYMLKYRRPAMSRSGEQLARRAARFGKFVVVIGHNAKRGAHFRRMPRCGWDEDVLDAQKIRKPRASYAVGYARPPTSSQFQPGQSGNPKGRPKGTRNASLMARDALERTTNVKVKGSWRKMTVRKAAYLRLAERAVAGNAKALDFVVGERGARARV